MSEINSFNETLEDIMASEIIFRFLVLRIEIMEGTNSSLDEVR